ncbi:MAG: ADP-ribosylglycohydrolase family protein [Planctomycetota bacterium]
MDSSTKRERARAILLAGALGDAIGATYEGKDAPTEIVVADHLLVTDDTQLTLATCQSIIAERRIDPESIARQFLEWFRARRLTGLGSSTLKALVDLDAGGHWAMVGAQGERTAGNGAAMRIAPLSFLLDPEDELDRQTLRDVCQITHHHDEAYVGALAIALSLKYVMAGEPLDGELLSLLLAALPDSRVRDRLLKLRERTPTVADYANEFGATGYVVDSVPLAILAALNARDFDSLIQEIIACGGDTDTIASMAAQVFAAARGRSALPEELTARLDVAELLTDTVRQMEELL